MLDAWIIDEITRKEREGRETGVPLELPLPMPIYREPEPEASPDADRGVCIIDL